MRKIVPALLLLGLLVTGCESKLDRIERKVDSLVDTGHVVEAPAAPNLAADMAKIVVPKSDCVSVLNAVWTKDDIVWSARCTLPDESIVMVAYHASKPLEIEAKALLGPRQVPQPQPRPAPPAAPIQDAGVGK